MRKGIAVLLGLVAFAAELNATNIQLDLGSPGVVSGGSTIILLGIAAAALVDSQTTWMAKA